RGGAVAVREGGAWRVHEAHAGRETIGLPGRTEQVREPAVLEDHRGARSDVVEFEVEQAQLAVLEAREQAVSADIEESAVLRRAAVSAFDHAALGAQRQLLRAEGAGGAGALVEADEAYT